MAEQTKPAQGANKERSQGQSECVLAVQRTTLTASEPRGGTTAPRTMVHNCRRRSPPTPPATHRPPDRSTPQQPPGTSHSFSSSPPHQTYTSSSFPRANALCATLYRALRQNGRQHKQSTGGRTPLNDAPSRRRNIGRLPPREQPCASTSSPHTGRRDALCVRGRCRHEEPSMPTTRAQHTTAHRSREGCMGPRFPTLSTATGTARVQS